MIKIHKLKKEVTRIDNVIKSKQTIRVELKNFIMNNDDLRTLERKYKNTSFGHYNNKTFFSFSCTEKSSCAPEDVFDFNIGKKIAEARCTNKARAKISRILKCILNIQGAKLKEIRDFNANIVYDDMEKVLAEFYNNNQED